MFTKAPLRARVVQAALRPRPLPLTLPTSTTPLRPSLLPHLPLKINLANQTRTGFPPYLHDNILHNPLGGGSYLFKSNFIKYNLDIALSLPPLSPSPTPTKVKELIIHIGAQPNNSPHVGTLVTFALALQVAKRFEVLLRGRERERESEVKVKVSLELVDTAPDNELSEGGGVPKGDYRDVLKEFGELAGGDIEVKMTDQEDLARSEKLPEIVRRLIKERRWLGPMLAPERGLLGLRAACPECGLADKPGLKNVYHDTIEGEEKVEFECPHHGVHHVDLRDPEEFRKLEYNAPLRNLIRALVLSSSNEEEAHIRVTGSDYAGGYQENFLYRPLHHLSLASHSTPLVPRPPHIIYSPLIVDWAGSKISKSLYIRKGGYEYLKEYGLDYLLSLERMREDGRELKIIWDEVGDWVDEPRKLFRSYSVEYMNRVFEEAG